MRQQTLNILFVWRFFILLPLMVACSLEVPTIYQPSSATTTQVSADEARRIVANLAHEGRIAWGGTWSYNHLRSVAVQDDRIEFVLTSAGSVSCPFDSIKTGVVDYGFTAFDFRYSVDLGCGIEFGFSTEENSRRFAEALYILQHRPLKAVTATVAAALPESGRAVIDTTVDTLPSAKAQLNRDAYALVIGIERYRQQLPTANFAVHDAEIVSAYLTQVLGYPEENVVTLLNDRASYVDLAKYFDKWLPNNVEQGATVFVYFSGHGAPNPKTGDAYLVPYDGDPAFIDETGYSLKRLYAALGKLPAKSIVVALDSCFSGAGGRSVIAKGARSITMNLKETTLPSNNMTVLAASSGDQMSSTYDEKGHGLFTYFFLKGIKNEDVVASDGTLRLDDLFAYLQPQVERVARKQYNNEQTPQLIEAGR